MLFSPFAKTTLQDRLKWCSFWNDVCENTDKLVMKYNKGENNLRTLLDFLQKNQLAYGKVFSELPTLNDVFLEITGKELRD